MSTELLADDLQRADASDLGTPSVGTYETIPGVAQPYIQSNRMYYIGSNGEFRNMGWRKNCGTGKTDHGIFQTHVGEAAAMIHEYWVRWNGLLSGQTGYCIRLQSNGTCTLDYYLSGSGTIVANLGGIPAAGDEYGLVIKGNVLFVIRNGSVTETITHNSLTAGDYTGFIARCATSGTVPTYQFASAARAFSITAQYNPQFQPRLAYDRDGSTVTSFGSNQGAATFTTAQKVKLNNELNDYASSPDGFNINNNQAHYLQIDFPSPRDIYGLYWGGIYRDDSGNTYYPFTSYAYATSPGVYVSSGLTLPAVSDFTSPAFRSGILQVNLPNIYGIQVRYNTSGNFGFLGSFMGVHLYGRIRTGAAVHRVALWHPYANLPLPGDLLDMDDVGRGSVRTREFRVKNISPSLTMVNTVLDIESLSFGTVVTDQYSIKRASQGTYQANTTVASLAPGALSEIVSVRRIVSGSAAYRVDAPRIRVSVESMA